MARLNLETMDKGIFAGKVQHGNTTIRFYDVSHVNRSEEDCKRSCKNIAEIICRLATEGQINGVEAVGVTANFVRKTSM